MISKEGKAVYPFSWPNYTIFFLIPENEFPRRLRVYEYDALQYYAPSGETVQVPRFVRPYEVLQIAANAPFHEIKESFRRSANHSSRQKRAMASLAYIILASKDQRYKKTNWGTYEITDKNLNDVIVLAAIGATTRLLAQIRKNKGLLTSIDEHKHTLLYLTARSGYYDTTEALLKMGVQVNETQVDDSTYSSACRCLLRSAWHCWTSAGIWRTSSDDKQMGECTDQRGQF